jgi:exodeoxyribonuclease V alpha subunit
MSEIEYFAGRVQTVRFSNDAQSYYVLNMLMDDGSIHTVRGHVPGLEVQAGTWFGFEAHWEVHATYGKQLVIDKAPVLKDGWDVPTAIKMLQGHGVGVRICESLLAHFGDDLLTVLADSSRLQEVPAITEFTANYIVTRWHTVRAMFQSLKFLGDLGLPKAKVDQIYSQFGDNAERILSEDPWSLVQIEGITFDHADEVARRLRLDMESPQRLRGATLAACKSRRGLGHLFMTSGELLDCLRPSHPTVEKAEVAKTLKQLRDEDLLVLDNRTRAGVTAIYEPWFNLLEHESARMLAERSKDAQILAEEVDVYLKKLATVGPKTREVAEDQSTSLAATARMAIQEWSSHGNLKLSEAQLQGAVNALTEPVSVVTGLPGTGKTTLLRVVVKVLQDAAIPFLLAAPTGIAAKRLTMVTGAEAFTVHRAFGAKGMDLDGGREATYAGIVGDSNGLIDTDGSRELWGYSAAQPHPAKIVVVDESSMLDQHLLFRLLTCTSRDCRIVFVGDAAQLPSVGPGNVLRDMIQCGFFPVVALRDIFRQDEASDIVLAAHAINSGRVPKFEHKSLDYTFHEVRDEARILDTLIATVQKLYVRNANFQVLSPRHAGTLGVTNLNVRLRELLNPKTPTNREMRLGSETIREGDRVMVSKNNYRFEIFNGDVGKVKKLDLGSKIITVKIHGAPGAELQVDIPFKEAASLLRLAYAITTHKSQGQEYDIILLPWSNSFRQQLQRNLVYTAITRARKKVILIGHPEAMEKAVANNRVDDRNTLFPERLRAILGGEIEAASGE